MFIPTQLRTALENSISSGRFIDTKFWVFNRRNRETGQLEEPRAIFASSIVVGSIPYLNALLDGVPETPLDTGFPETTEEPLLRDYEYKSDGDLFDGMAQSAPPTSELTSEQDQIEGHGLSLPNLGRTVVIKDAAFVTFHAVLAYLYTREIEFGSRDRIGTWFGPCVPSATAKSIYRLADKYGITDLKELASFEIKSAVKKCNIIEESFGEFASLYPEIRELYMYRLAHALRSSDPPEIAAAFDAKIQAYFAGKLPHAKDLVLSLFDFLMSNKVPPHPPPPRRPQSTIMPHFGENHSTWIPFRDAIIRSLTTGVFVDSVFYVEDSTELRPLFFCGSIISPLIKKISEISKVGPVCPLRGGSEQPTLRGVDIVAAQNVTREKALVVTMGDFRSWKSIFLYIYSAKISFAPFGSSASPPAAESPSSPGIPHEAVNMKQIYELATKISLNPLRDIVHQEIKSSMTSENIVGELFSTFSAEHESIREMQYRLLREEFWTAGNQEGLRMKIEESNGQISHHGSAMAAVFRGLIGDERAEETAKAEGTVEVIDQPPFHAYTEKDPCYPKLMLAYQTITAAPVYQNVSQEELRLKYYRQNPRTTLDVHPPSFPPSKNGNRNSAFRLM